MIDIVFVGEEQKALAMAEKLGLKKLVVAYSYGTDKKRVEGINSGVEVVFGIDAKAGEIKKAKQKSDIVLYKAEGNYQDVLMKHKPDIVYGLEEVFFKDKMHYRMSGLNQVIAKICVKNRIIIGVDFSRLSHAYGVYGAKVLGRVKQNLRIADKYGVKIFLGSFCRDGNLKDLNCVKEMFNVFGYNKMAKDNCLILDDKIRYNQDKRSGKIVNDHVQIID